MIFLLDTHALIWFLEDESKLPPKTKSVLSDASISCCISIATLWEMTIKSQIGKLELSFSLAELIESLVQNSISIIPIEPSHLQKLLSLDSHHKDPFDRLIIAQALHEGMTIISKDQYFKAYNVTTLWD
jgi:PIN domain nuclease of toxin-antitoxin system